MARFPNSMLMTLLLISLFSCVRHENSEISSLRDEISRLRQTVLEIKPGLGEIMGAIQQHHEKLYFSGEHANWELARYELDEINENLVRGTDLYAHFKDLKTPLDELKHITDSSMKGLDKAINEQSHDKFKEEFKNLTQSCNQCHQAAQHGFIQIQLPKNQTLSNQKF